jgi:hypothetical protein
MMKQPRAILLVVLALLAPTTALVSAGQKTPNETADIWEDEPQDARQPRWYRWYSNEVADRIMKGIEQRDPEKAKRLAALRKKDPEKFKAELGRHGRKEIEEISHERLDAWRKRWKADFIQWIKTNYPQEEKDLAGLEEKNPQLYVKRYEHLRAKYGHIFEADQDNPELGAVLKEDLELKVRRDRLLARMHREKSDARRQAVGAELQEVVSRRYDLIVRRKEIAYEHLLKKLEGLQAFLKQSKEEIVKSRDNKVRQENIRRRLEALTEDQKRFKWD